MFLHTQGSTMIEKAKSELARFKLEGKPCPCVGSFFLIAAGGQFESLTCLIWSIFARLTI